MENTELLEPILDDNEKVIWTTKPKFLPFILSGIPFLIIGLAWGTFDLGFMRLFTNVGKGASNQQFTSFFNLFYLFIFFHMMPCWLSIGNMIRLLFVWNNIVYAFTDKRVILRSGFWGIDYRTIDYDSVRDANVNVNPIDSMLGVGSISINTGKVTNRGVAVLDTMIGVSNPYEAFKKLKTVSVDVKTDWNYPNKLRPAENPGYQTKLTKEEN